MAIVQGDSYKLIIKLTDCEKNVIEPNDINAVQFQFNGLLKEYSSAEVEFDTDLQAYLVPLTEEETFLFQRAVKCQARVEFADGDICGTVPKLEYLYDSIITEKFNKETENTNNEQND